MPAISTTVNVSVPTVPPWCHPPAPRSKVWPAILSIDDRVEDPRPLPNPWSPVAAAPIPSRCTTPRAASTPGTISQSRGGTSVYSTRPCPRKRGVARLGLHAKVCRCWPVTVLIKTSPPLSPANCLWSIVCAFLLPSGPRFHYYFPSVLWTQGLPNIPVYLPTPFSSCPLETRQSAG
ncbi:hypothetical protein VTI74DRAFT_72 [Chaetomium olivicolor]